MEDFSGYFSDKKRLLPKHSDLSYYNWDTNYVMSTSTPNYQACVETVVDCCKSLHQLLKCRDLRQLIFHDMDYSVSTGIVLLIQTQS